MIEALIGLFFAATLFFAGLWLVQTWRQLGEMATQHMSPQLLFGPAGERLLYVLGVVMMGGGSYVAAQALRLIASP